MSKIKMKRNRNKKKATVNGYKSQNFVPFQVVRASISIQNRN